jgi:hypothetical protein
VATAGKYCGQVLGNKGGAALEHALHFRSRDDIRIVVDCSESDPEIGYTAKLPRQVGEQPGHETPTTILDNASLQELSGAICENDAEGQGKLTTLEATYTCGNYIMNPGILSVPFVFMRCGFMAAALIVLSCGACICTAWLLGEVFSRLQTAGVARPTYGDIAGAMWGQRFGSLVNVTCHAELVTYGFFNLIVLAHTAHDLLPGFDFSSIALVSSTITLGLSVLSDKMYAYVSLLSVTAIVLVCIGAVLSGIMVPEWAPVHDIVGPAEWLPSSFAILLFNAGTHPMLPTLFSNTQSKTDYQCATRNAWILWAIFGICFGGVAYCIFGSAIQVVITRNIGRDLTMAPMPNVAGLATLSAVLLVVKLQTAQIGVCRPFADSLGRALGLQRSGRNGGFVVLLSSAPVLAAFCLGAIALRDQLAQLSSMSGGFLMSWNALVFPALAYLRVCSPQLAIQKVIAMGVITLGFALATFLIRACVR